MKAKVSWVEGMKFVGESESGHQVTLDGANPGEGRFNNPVENLSIAVKDQLTKGKEKPDQKKTYPDIVQSHPVNCQILKIGIFLFRAGRN